MLIETKTFFIFCKIAVAVKNLKLRLQFVLITPPNSSVYKVDITNASEGVNGNFEWKLTYFDFRITNDDASGDTISWYTCLLCWEYLLVKQSGMSKSIYIQLLMEYMHETISNIFYKTNEIYDLCCAYLLPHYKTQDKKLSPNLCHVRYATNTKNIYSR